MVYMIYMHTIHSTAQLLWRSITQACSNLAFANWM